MAVKLAFDLTAAKHSSDVDVLGRGANTPGTGQVGQVGKSYAMLKLGTGCHDAHGVEEEVLDAGPKGVPRLLVYSG